MANSAVTYDYVLSVADLMMLRGLPLFAQSRTYIFSNVSHAGFDVMEEAVYGATAGRSMAARGQSSV